MLWGGRRKKKWRICREMIFFHCFFDSSAVLGEVLSPFWRLSWLQLLHICRSVKKLRRKISGCYYKVSFHTCYWEMVNSDLINFDWWPCGASQPLCRLWGKERKESSLLSIGINSLCKHLNHHGTAFGGFRENPKCWSPIFLIPLVNKFHLCDCFY